MKTAWRNFIRNRGSNLISVLAAAVLTAFLLVYCNNIKLSEAELENAYETIPVTAYITNISAAYRPVISEERFDAVVNSGFVTSYITAAQCDINKDDTLKGLESIEADSLLEGLVEQTEWFEGYDESCLSGNDAVCIVPRTLGLAAGDTFSFKLGTSKETTELEVAAVYGSEFMSTSNGMVIYCPLASLKDIYEQNDTKFAYSMLEMELCNTKQLDDFRKLADELGLKGGSAKLIINDTLLASVTTELTKHITLLKALLGALFVLIVAIGFGISFLLLRRRTRETAVMRSIGATRMQTFSILIIECMLQAILGGIIAVVLVLLTFGREAAFNPLAAVVMLCYIAGGAIASLKLANVNVLKLMTAKE